ncbi:MAG: amino acid adenylation domain-containing protein [Bryobacteraceae bacterium]
MLAETDRQLLRNWNRTESEYPRDLCIHEVFERQAAKTPDAVAVVFKDTRWTYGELNSRANGIASHLRDLGVVRDSLVALLMERSPETVAALLGILKAGGAYAPLDPNDPPARIQALLADLHPVALLTEPALTQHAGGVLAPVIETAAITGASETNPENISSADGLAYVMFTSGSTGSPKGVMVEHRSVVRLVKNTNYASFDDKQVFLQLAPLPFDASTLEIWGPLLNGAVLAIMPPGLPSLADIAQALRQHRVTALWLSAGLFHAMVDQQLEALAELRQLTSGGDVLSPAHVRRLLDAAPGIRLMNGYGPTEGTVFTCCYTIPQDHPADLPVPIGKPIANTTVYILDGQRQLVAPGQTGELYTGGDGIARGYLNQPELTAERFLDDPFSGRPGARLYRTGDLARFREDGVVEFLGRADKQVKLRGFRVELGEIETALNQHGGVSQSAVALKEGRSEQKSLIAWVVPREGNQPAVADLRAFLAGRLPPYMIPAQFVVVDTLPLNANGKVDRRALAELKDDAPAAQPPQSEVERIITEVWEQALGVASPDPDLAFFDQGGNSLQLLQVQGHLEARLHTTIAISDLFLYPSIRSLAGFLAPNSGTGDEFQRGIGDTPTGVRTGSTWSQVECPPIPLALSPESRCQSPNWTRDVAIVGMAGRFPGAKNVGEFWENLKNGVESITRFSDDEAEARKGPGTVKARSILDDVDKFDASFFGILPKEAELMDPQHRVFLECSSAALDDAGCDPSRYRGRVGVFAGCSPNSYFLRHLCVNRDFIENYVTGYQVDNYTTMLGTSPDFLCSRVSYKLNLTGPSITMGTACSTSLVAVTQACESLIGGQCDMALAGGVSITLPQKRGYTPTEGGLASADGHCRAFDADAQGTVFGSGCAVVVLKRLEDAVADGDSIYAVIKGYGVNNDGAGKVGFAAPGVAGQTAAIRKAHEMSGVDPATITYVEAHGTATPLGDPIEIAALTEAFRARTSRTQFCAIGTAKTNVGHLDAAAGTTALIKTALSIRHGILPASLHFRKPNPRIDFASSPFYVNAALAQWKPAGVPRRAGVSAFGIGGTNAHVVLEEGPEPTGESAAFSHHLLTISAKSESALQRAAADLAGHLQSNTGLDLADAAWTLQTGRRQFAWRRTVVCSSAQDAVKQLSDPAGKPETCPTTALPLVFAFPGQGAQYPGMGRELYAALPVFRQSIDECAEILRPMLGLDLRDAIHTESLNQTALAQPAIFALEYALAKQWMSWGVRPQAMVGHSVGEFVAACLAGVFSLSDALSLVAARGRMMQDLPGGVMLSVRASADKVRHYLTAELALAAVNSPSLCVVSGPASAVEPLEVSLNGAGIPCRRLRTSHAFHSPMVDPILAPLAERIRQIALHPPQIPYVSTLTGDWITAEQTTDADYFARHCRETVQFSAAVSRLQNEKPWCVLEVGPGQALTTLVRQHGDKPNELKAVASLPAASADQPEMAALLSALGRLWQYGNEPDWNEIYKGQRRARVSLPSYPFERKRHWIDPPQAAVGGSSRSANSGTGDEFPHRKATDKNPPVTAETSCLSPNWPRNDFRHGLTAQSETKTEKEQVMEVSIPMNAGRQERLRSELLSLLEELSGLELNADSIGTTFLDLGFDSLFLTQVTQSLESRYGVKIRFAQLLDDLSTLQQLAAYLDSVLPADAVAEPVVTAAPARAPEPTAAVTAPAGGIERLLKDQLQAFNDLAARQIEMMRSLTAPSATLPPAAHGSNGRSANSGTGDEFPHHEATENRPSVGAESRCPSPNWTPPKPEAPKFEAFGPYKPPQRTAPASGFTARQQEYLDAFIARYTARTRESKRLTQAHRAILADPRVASGFRAQWKDLVYPLTVVRSSGSKLYDADGNEYIDLQNGFGVTMFGHCPSFVREAVEEQLHTGIEIGPQTPYAGKVAELVCELTGMERTAFCNTGSEAVMAALRLARTVSNRKKIAYFTGDYHGTFDEVLLKATGKPGGEPKSRPVAPGIPDEMAANAMVLEYGSPASLEIVRAHAHELAAVLVEPVQSRHPDLQPVEFLRELRAITEQAGVALIFDEVVTGFRTHPGGVQALFGIRADMATYGKVIGGGLPIGVLAGKAKYMDALDGGMWQYGDDSFPEVGVTFFAGTFVRHPLAMAAAHAVLTHLKEAGPQLQEELSAKTGRLVRRLNDLFEEGAVPTRIQNFRSIFYFGFPAEQRFAGLLYYHLIEKGVNLREGFPCFLTTAHTDEDLERIVQAFRDSIAEMQEGGFLPVPASRMTGIPVEAPLTEAQMEIRLSAQLGDEESCSYNEGFTVRLCGRLNETALRDSLQTVVDRHEALRATLTESGDSLRILPRVELQFPRGIGDTPTGLAGIEAIKDQDAKTAFDLIHGPLIRARLIRLSADDHVLFVTAHHMVCDGWSINVILDELSKLYTAKCQGLHCELPVPLRFSEYANDQARQSIDANIERYWVSEFAEPVPPLELPLDRPRPALKSYRGFTHTAKIDAETAQKIRKAGAKRGSTLFSTLLCGFQTLLSRLTAQSDIVVGIPAAAQSALAGQTLVGHCVNLLPIRLEVDGEAKFSDVLARSRRKLLDAYEHQSYTYGTLVRKLAIPRNPSRLPLVEVQFNVERIGARLDFHGIDASVTQSPKRFVNFDLFLNIVDSPDGLTLHCDYNTDLFDDSTVARWLRYYETLLVAFAGDADQPVSSMPLLSAADRDTMLAAWNNTAAEYPQDKCVHQLFEEQAAETPDAIAASFGSARITYRELNRRTNQLAHWLQRNGAGHGALVGISLEPSLDMLTAVLGVLKAGAAYLPLDPYFPEDRLAFIRQDAGVALVLSADNWPVLEAEPATALPTVPAHQLAYVLYTSGSTGKPKGVEIEHRALTNFLWSMRREPGISAADRLLAVTTLSFDIAGLELYLPLIAGAEVVIASHDTTRDGKELMSLIERAGITIMQATPTTWKLLLEAGWMGNPKLKMLCGGEELTRELANELVPRGASLWNMYGPTETTIWSAVHQVTAGDGPVSIGRPIANTQMYVLDEHGQPTAAGVPGELCIAGDGLARGYRKRPELTEKKFVSDPFAGSPSARMYRTGDLARHLPDGRLLCLGRLDNQVKIRGYRIELGEIESALLGEPAVRDGAVIVRQDQPGDKRLVAYIVAAQRNAFDATALRDALAKRLPDYMVPGILVALDSLPLTPNGKIDRRALGALPPPSAAVREDRYVAPRTEPEKVLASVWQQVLKVQRVGIDDDLFTLGADSIHLFQIASRAASQGVAITPKQLLQYRTIGALSAVMDRDVDTAREPVASAIRAVSRDRFRVRRPV